MQPTRLPPLSALRAFEAAARNLSFSAAGRELNVTHVAVGQQVRRLEELLGVVLVLRHPRGLELTPEGARLAAGLVEGFGRLREAIDELREVRGDRPLRVTLTPMFAASWLMPRLGEFRSAHPDIELMLNPTPERVDLRREDYDLAIRYGAGEWAGLEAEPFIPSRFVIVARRELVEGVRLETPADLARLPWLMQQGTDEFDIWLSAHGVRVEGKHNITHLPGYLLLPAIREGHGVGCTTRLFIEQDLRAGRLVSLFEDGPGDMRAGYYLVRRPGPMREPLKALVRWLHRAARADPEGAVSQSAPG
ncbi:MAG TPA: LysR substrate-binding domain-containing protein [Thermohalobaculum sp.]|nr:LysR substrate-binding domain-containing protein [Thermohalobaculum sp.]